MRGPVAVAVLLSVLSSGGKKIIRLWMMDDGGVAVCFILDFGFWILSLEELVDFVLLLVTVRCTFCFWVLQK